jgi:pilus assembly protein CpaF
MIGKYMTATVTEAERTISLSSYADFGLPVPLSLKVAREDQPSVSDFGNLVQHIQSKVLEKFQVREFSKLPEDKQKTAIRLVAEQLIDAEKIPLSGSQRTLLMQDLLDEIVGLGPLEKLLRDSAVTDILVNGAKQIYVERRGRLQEVADHFRDEDHLLTIIDRIVSRVGRRVDFSSPVVDARLPDGSRVNAVIRPVALRGPTLSIRRFGVVPLQLHDLLQFKALTPNMAQFLEAAVKARLNIIISGGTGSGKTTLLNTLSAFIPNTERIISIEDAAELQLQQRQVVQLEARPANLEGKGEITIRDLLRTTLRMRPNRIIIGECRGPEAFDMLQAMNTGHDGSLTTLHANSPRDALSRLEMMMMMAVRDVPLHVIREQIASAVNVIVQVDRLTGGPRRVTSITEVMGCASDVITTQEIFRFKQLGVTSAGNALGAFEAAGIPSCNLQRIHAAGIVLPLSIFHDGDPIEA